MLFGPATFELDAEKACVHVCVSYALFSRCRVCLYLRVAQVAGRDVHLHTAGTPVVEELHLQEEANGEINYPP